MTLELLVFSLTYRTMYEPLEAFFSVILHNLDIIISVSVLIVALIEKGGGIL